MIKQNSLANKMKNVYNKNQYCCENEMNNKIYTLISNMLGWGTSVYSDRKRVLVPMITHLAFGPGSQWDPITQVGWLKLQKNTGRLPESSLIQSIQIG